MLLITGDSFSAPNDHPVWHDFIQPNPKKKINLAWHGAGNFYMADSIQHMIKTNHKTIKKVIVFWSEYHRLDLLVEKPFDMYHRWTSTGCWQFSGGIDDGSTKWKKLFRKIYTTQGWDAIIARSIDQIKNTLHQLDHYQIDYNFGFTYPDIHNKIFNQHKKLIPVNFKTWIDEHNLKNQDGHHPSAEGQRFFAQAIKQYIK